MAGPLIERELSIAASKGRWRFTVATPADDGVIRRLLRNCPMAGSISLSFEREPDYFAGANLAGNKDQTLLAWNGEKLACVGRCSIRSCYVNGEIRRVAYLAELRLAEAARGQIEVVRHGYEFLRELHELNPPDFYFTSIAADNDRARRVLERGLPGMPRYRFLTEFVTRLIPVPSESQARRKTEWAKAKLTQAGYRVARGTSGKASVIVEFLNEAGRNIQLASAWTNKDLLALASHGLPMERFQLLIRDDRIVAVGALWDQRAFRQTVIRGYAPALKLGRPWINFCANIFGVPRLPAVGEVLGQAFLSPLLASDEAIGCIPEFIQMFFQEAAAACLEYLTLGIAAGDPLLKELRRNLRGREYLSRLYQVSWRDSEMDEFGSNLIGPEVGLL